MFGFVTMVVFQIELELLSSDKSVLVLEHVPQLVLQLVPVLQSELELVILLVFVFLLELV